MQCCPESRGQILCNLQSLQNLQEGNQSIRGSSEFHKSCDGSKSPCKMFAIQRSPNIELEEGHIHTQNPVIQSWSMVEIYCT